MHDIAGVVNDRGNVCGLMPHPERAAEALLGSDDGMLLFRSVIESAAASAGTPAAVAPAAATATPGAAAPAGTPS